MMSVPKLPAAAITAVPEPETPVVVATTALEGDGFVVPLDDTVAVELSRPDDCAADCWVTVTVGVGGRTVNSVTVGVGSRTLVEDVVVGVGGLSRASVVSGVGGRVVDEDVAIGVGVRVLVRTPAMRENSQSPLRHFGWATSSCLVEWIPVCDVAAILAVRLLQSSSQSLAIKPPYS